LGTLPLARSLPVRLHDLAGQLELLPQQQHLGRQVADFPDGQGMEHQDAKPMVLLLPYGGQVTLETRGGVGGGWPGVKLYNNRPENSQKLNLKERSVCADTSHSHFHPYARTRTYHGKSCFHQGRCGGCSKQVEQRRHTNPRVGQDKGQHLAPRLGPFTLHCKRGRRHQPQSWKPVPSSRYWRGGSMDGSGHRMALWV
jgi:hypothetical protein